MEFPKKNKSCENHRSNSAEMNCQACSESNKDMCALCGKEMLFELLSNDMSTGDNLPDNICQCFFSEIDISGAKSTTSGCMQTTEVPVTEISDSLSNIAKIKDEITCTQESSSMTTKEFVSSSEESEILQCSHSSNGYLSSLEELSSDQNSTDLKNKTSPSSGDDSKKSPPENAYSSSGYPLSLEEQSSDRYFTDHKNLTSPSSDDDSKNSSNLESDETKNFYDSGSISNSYKILSDEYMCDESSQSDEEVHRRQKGEDSSNPKSVKINKNAQNENISSEGEKFVFSNPNIEISKVRPVLPRPFPQHRVQLQTFPQLYPQYASSSLNMQRSTSHSQLNPQYESSSLNMQRSTSHSQLNPQYESSSLNTQTSTSHSQLNPQYESSLSTQRSRSHSRLNPQYESSSLNTQRSTSHSQLNPQYESSSLNIQRSTSHSQHYRQSAISSLNMQMPISHFEFHPQSASSSLSMQMPAPHSEFYLQPFQPYANPVVNMPVIPYVPERFPVSSRPQLSTSYYQSSHGEGRGLSRRLLSQIHQRDLRQDDVKNDRIKNWLHNIKTVPPEEILSSDWASNWSSISNEEIVQTFSGTSTDERSSTEISEEENRRQRALRRPPRNIKKSKPK